MAIQIRRGSNAEWETNNSNIVVGEPAVATDSKRAFIGTASGAYMELANLEAIAPAYDPGNSYMIDDYVSYQGKLYVCTVPTSGAWDASCWQVTSLGQALAENAYSNFEMQTVSGDIVSFPNGAGGIPVKDLQVSIEAVQSGSGDPSPTNIRPISGWDEVNVNVVGKNLAVEFGNYYTDASGVIQSSSLYLSYVVKVQNGETYTFSQNGVKGTIPVIAYYKDYPRLGSASYNGSRLVSVDGTFISPIDGYAIIRMQSTDTHDVQVEVGTTASSFEPNGTTYTIDLDGTRYGGTLDVTTGVLTVTHGYVDLGTLNWSLHGSYANTFYADVTGKKQKSIDFISSAYSNGGLFSSYANLQNGVMYTSNGENSRIAVKNTSYATAYDFKTAMTGQQLVYELAAPQTYQLTPTQVRTVLGYNNIFADSGSIEVTYRVSNAV